MSGIGENQKIDLTQLYAELGRLVVAWNDIDATMRTLIFAITLDRGAHTALILTTDMNSSGLMTALRTLANERDAFEENRSKDKDTIALIAAGHIGHFIEYVDRIREYRNYYVHGIRSPNAETGVVARSMSARGRFIVYSQPVTIGEIAKLIERINICKKYGGDLSSIIFAMSHVRADAPVTPTWPERPPWPDKLVKRPLTRPDEESPPPPFQA